ncbi:IclR family transcriptional regulator [Halomarina halobia]|uniref:IclR family transcriptional regulator n=1 Tax=Halomarina halobia TaxID=3033386 RepID=A0ABD6AF82_9EURY|nr:IclR family transcriptional regulator [Halomarina sp. PSR21]
MTNTVRSLRRADRLVEWLVESEMASVTTMAEELDMPLSTVYDYVRTLESLNYLTKLPDGRYRVSTRYLKIGNEVRHRYEVYTVAEPELTELAADTGEYIALMIEEGGLGVILSMKEGEMASHVKIHRTYAGTRTRLNTTATGKAILARLPEERTRHIVDEYGLSSKTANTITDPDELFEELERIRNVGYAIDDEERFEGMRGIGVPVVSKPDETVGAIGLYGPAHRLTDTVLREDLPERILEVANVVQVSLTYS